MPKIVILIGNIGAGKSTICKKYIKKDYVILSRDALRYMIGAGNYCFDESTEPAIKSSYLLMIEEFLKIGQNIVIDECCVTKFLRKSIIDIGKKYNYKIVGVVFPRFSMEVSVNRRLQEPHGNFGKNIWEIVWKQFDLAYQEPEMSEGFNNLYYLEK